MKILFDARWIRVDVPNDGISRYSSNLVTELIKYPDINLTVLIHDKQQLDSLPDSIPYIKVHNPGNILKEYRIARNLNSYNFDIVYSPFFIMGSRGRNYHLILTIHDLIYFTHQTPPQWLKWHIRLVWRLFHLSYKPLRCLLNTADIIATVSNTARRDLLDHKITDCPIYTVFNAVSQNFVDTKPSNHARSHRVVYMGAFTPYKNVECLIRAVAIIPNIVLDLCSKIPPKRRRQIEALIDQHNIKDRVVIYNGVSDQQYHQLLHNARCLATASRLEGFGLPIIEAQQAGVPVICSNTAIFHEVGQDSVLYFDPDSPSQAAAQITLLGKESESQSVIKRGYANARRYTWQKSAQQAVTIFKSIVKQDKF